MKVINLHNYESYFLDYIEGNLSQKDRLALVQFLDNYPDLLIEFHALSLSQDDKDVILIPKQVEFEDKDDLKKFGEEVSRFNVDFWMVQFIEGELSFSEEQKLMKFVKTNQLENQLEFYQNTILVPRSESYEYKSDLKRYRRSLIPVWYKIPSVAAAVIFLLVGLFFAEDFKSHKTPTKYISNSFKEVLYPKKKVYHPGLIEGRKSIIVNQGDQNKTDIRLTLIGELDSIAPNSNGVHSSNLISLSTDNSLIIDDSNDPTQEFIKDTTMMIPDFDCIVETSEELSVEFEEPYKIFTDVASNIVNREISYKRHTKEKSDLGQVQQFKFGKFEFERKKSR